MAKTVSPEQRLIDTYETITISFLPIAAQIRHHFPVIDNLVPPQSYLMPALLTAAQILHALAVPPLRQGIQGSAKNIKLLKKIGALQDKLREEQKLIYYWHDELVKIHNDKTVKEDYSNVLEQLATSAKNIITLQEKLEGIKLKARQLVITQQIVAVGQDREWLRYEEGFVDAVIQELDKHHINIDTELKENVIKKRTTLDAMLEKFKARNFPIPEELANV